ncbi:MAG: HD-GYP domain-containing protein [Planctomycetota bacterium]
MTDTVGDPAPEPPRKQATRQNVQESETGNQAPSAEADPAKQEPEQPSLQVPQRFLTARTGRLIRSSTRTLIRVLDCKDQYTLRHSERVTALAVHLATACRVRAKQVQLIRLSGMLHDVGKVYISKAILNKPRPLTHTERGLVKRHVDTGFELLQKVEYAEPVACAVRHHHERWDGQGYPDGLERENIPLASRFISVADAFDAMASHRPYRQRLPRKKIRRELRREKGRQFDPVIVDKLLHWYRPLSGDSGPMRSRLSSGEDDSVSTFDAQCRAAEAPPDYRTA